MPKRTRNASLSNQRPDPDTEPREPRLRVIGGKFRGRRLKYTGDERTRPMKDRVREALFNLIGPRVEGMHAFDLFSGTGALGLEALSRGAATATMLERHFPTATVIRENVAALGLQSLARVVGADTLVWALRELPPPDRPWLVFCSPPYEMYVDQRQSVLKLLNSLLEAAPRQSLFAVEADSRFDFAELPLPECWDIRAYPPAIVGLHCKTDADDRRVV